MSHRSSSPDLPITVAIASRDRVYQQVLSASLARRGIRVRSLLPSTGGAWGSLEGVDVMVLDTGSLTPSDLDRAAVLQGGQPLVEVVAIAGDSPVSDAVKALRAGVFTVLQHPVADGLLVDALLAAGRRHRHARARLQELNGTTAADRIRRRGDRVAAPAGPGKRRT